MVIIEINDVSNGDFYLSFTEDETDNEFGEENSEEWGLKTGMQDVQDKVGNQKIRLKGI